MVYSNSTPGSAPTWKQLGQRFVRLPNTSPQVQSGIGFAKQSARTTKGVLAGVGRGASRAIPVLGGVADFASGTLLEGEDPIRAAAGAAGGTVGGIAGAQAGAMAGGALGALGGPLAPVTVPLGAVAGGIVGGISGSYAGGYLGDRADEAIRGPGSNPKPNASQRFWTGQSNSQAEGYQNNSMSSYPPIQGRYGRGQNPLAGSSNAVSQPYGPAMPVQQMQATPQSQRGSGVDPGLAAGAIGLGAGALGLGAFALSRGRVNPATAAKVAQSAGTAATAAESASGALGGIGKIAKNLAPAAIGSLVLVEGLKYAVAQPILRGVGIMPPAAAPPAGPRAAGPTLQDLKYGNPQAPGWVQAISGGRIQRLPGSQPGFEYTRLETQDATRRRGQDITQATKFREQDVKVYQSDVQAETQRRGQDKRLQGQDLVSGRQLEGTKYTADQRVKQADLTSGRQLEGTKYIADQRLKGQDLTSGRQLQGTMYTADKRLEGTVYSSDKKLEGTKYTADARLKGTVYNADKRLEGTVYSSDRRLEGTKYTADRNLQGKDLVSGRQLQGQVYTADRRYQGQVESAAITGESRIKVADTQGSYRLGTESIRQEGQAKVAQIRGDSLVRAAEARAGGGDGGRAEAAIYSANARTLSDSFKGFQADQTARRKQSSELARVYSMNARR